MSVICLSYFKESGVTFGWSYVMTYKMFSEKKLRQVQYKNNKVLV